MHNPRFSSFQVFNDSKSFQLSGSFFRFEHEEEKLPKIKEVEEAVELSDHGQVNSCCYANLLQNSSTRGL
jgi:hypothetical protein